MPGLIILGREVPLNLSIQNFQENPLLHLDPSDKRLRNAQERGWIHVVVVHTTKGIPGGKDLRAQEIRPGFGPSTNAGERIVGSWTHDRTRPGGAHLIVDHDGKCYCCADLGLEAAYHCKQANGVSVGIEVVQGASAELYEEQLKVAAYLAMSVCQVMPTPIQWQIPLPYTGAPLRRFVDSMHGPRPLEDVVGIIGHRDVTTDRGRGDPGDALMDVLESMGCRRVDFAQNEDRRIWQERQQLMGLKNPDGIPGPVTVAALQQRGFVDGIWRDSP